jgi:cellulose synthase/poly-beta-1,6-N-acetylglucosamine synthase-like glycosyltransferase
MLSIAENCRGCREVLVVLNGDAAREPIPEPVSQSTLPNLRVIREPNVGVSHARNAAVNAAGSPIIAFIDDDVLVDRHWPEEVAAGFEGLDVGCVTGTVTAEGGHGYGGDSRYQPSRFGDWEIDAGMSDWFQRAISNETGLGCNMAFTREFLRTVHFPADLGAGTKIGSADEPYMFFQVLKHHLRIRHASRATVTHIFESDASFAKDRTSQIYAGGVAFHLKLFFEEPGFRIQSVRELIRRTRRGIRRSDEAAPLPKSWSRLSFRERLAVSELGIRLYFQSKIGRS